MLETQALSLPLSVSYFWSIGAECFHFEDASLKMRKLSDGIHAEGQMIRNTVPTVSREVKVPPQMPGKCGTGSALDLWALYLGVSFGLRVQYHTQCRREDGKKRLHRGY